jgi:hypothetical protein
MTDVNDYNDDPVASYKYCYDGDQVIAEYDGSDNPKVKTVKSLYQLPVPI